MPRKRVRIPIEYAVHSTHSTLRRTCQAYLALGHELRLTTRDGGAASRPPGPLREATQGLPIELVAGQSRERIDGYDRPRDPFPREPDRHPIAHRVEVRHRIGHHAGDDSGPPLG